MRKLDKRMLQTKFGDHPSIISVGDDVQSFSSSIISLNGANQINMNKLDKRLHKKAANNNNK
jgi:hypothetical protein